MNDLTAGVEKINDLVQAKLQEVLGHNRYIQYKSITSKYQRVEFLFNELLRVLGITDDDKAKHVELLNAINSVITLCVSRNSDAPVTYEAFEYIMSIRDMAKSLAKDEVKTAHVSLILYEIIGLT